MLDVRLENYHLPRDPVGISGARLYLNPTSPVFPPTPNPPAANATTGRWGSVNVNVDALPPGMHVLWIIPANASADPVGPQTATVGLPHRVYRCLCIDLVISPNPTGTGTRVTNATMNPVTLNNGATTFDVSNQRLDVRLRPVWIESPTHNNRGATLDMIIVHRTGGELIGPALNQFLSGGTSCHYIIDRDGQIVKMVLDNQRAGHAGRNQETRWGSQTHLNDRSVGIENVARTGQALTALQYQSLIRLIQDLMSAHSVPRERVLGHSDIRTDASGVLNPDRIECPGATFDWPQLEGARGRAIGLSRAGGAAATDAVATFFAQMAAAGQGGLELRSGDRDPEEVGTQIRPGRFGGREYPEVTATPIAQIQTCLSEIGYSVGTADGGYGNRTARAVLHFQTHFVGQGATNTVNRATAALIRDVRAANPVAP